MWGSIYMRNKKALAALVAAIIVIVGTVVGVKHFASGNAPSETTLSSSESKSTVAETTSEKTTVTTTVKETEKPTSEATASSARVTTTKKKQSVTSTTKKYYPVETMTYREMDYSCFDDCAFIGNSRVLDLKNYGLAENVYASVGLNVNTVYTTKASGSDVPIIDELNGKHFSKVFLMFGDNECGWPNTSVFISKYAGIIDAVRERVPEAEIYIQSVLPISRAADARNEYGCNMQAINKINEALKQLAADEGVHYINVAASMTDSEGFLPDEAASDGVHLKKKYCRIWMNYIEENM